MSWHERWRRPTPASSPGLPDNVVFRKAGSFESNLYLLENARALRAFPSPLRILCDLQEPSPRPAESAALSVVPPVTRNGAPFRTLPPARPPPPASRYA